MAEVHVVQRNSRLVTRDPQNHDAYLRLCPL
jgi:hypothetical protein